MNIKVLIFAIGDIAYKDNSLKILRDYFSRREDMELVVIEDELSFNTKKAHAPWLKLISYNYVDENDFVLCWDLDLLPRDKNVVFDTSLLSEKYINLCYDTSVVLGHPRFNNNFYFNSGLIGIPKCMRSFTEEVYNLYAPGAYPSYEQYYLNDHLAHNKKDVCVLPNSYNTLQHNGPLFQNADFQHYTWQCLFNNTRDELIKKHYERYFRY